MIREVPGAKIAVWALRPFLAGTVTVLLASPLAAGACPLCYGSSSGRVTNAYYLSTLMLSVLPFAVVGVVAAVAWRVRRRARNGERNGDGPLRIEPAAS
ncbi:MAG: hypothetical protein ACE5I7_16500 [Candidatus Binatia bacterium]